MQKLCITSQSVFGENIQ